MKNLKEPVQNVVVWYHQCADDAQLHLLFKIFQEALLCLSSTRHTAPQRPLPCSPQYPALLDHCKKNLSVIKFISLKIQCEK